MENREVQDAAFEVNVVKQHTSVYFPWVYYKKWLGCSVDLVLAWFVTIDWNTLEQSSFDGAYAEDFPSITLSYLFDRGTSSE